jgi:hypothetical protein
MNKIIYQLTTKDIQDVAIELLGRKLTSKEIQTLIEPIETKIAWYDAIADSIHESFADEILEYEGAE